MRNRARKMMEYHYADLLQYGVVGAPDRLEYDQGFFVKNGDGAADVKPIAHLDKTQVFETYSLEPTRRDAGVLARPPQGGSSR